MSEARRGDIWQIDLGEPVGHEQGWRRPALVVSADGWNRHATTCVVLPLTRSRHGFPTRVEIEPTSSNGLRATSYARCEDIRSIDEERLVDKLGSVDALTAAQVSRVLRTFLAL